MALTTQRIKRFGQILGLLVVLIGVFVAISQGINKQEQIDCRRWAELAKERPDFYLTEWQQAQCDHWGITVFEPEPQTVYIPGKTGKASWYDYDLTGDDQDQKCTPDREPCYSQRADTCASRDYPRGTMLFVTYEIHRDGPWSVSRWVKCRVNDYGPQECPAENPNCEWAGRIIDLSSHAFEQLEDLSAGVITVTVEEIREE